MGLHTNNTPNNDGKAKQTKMGEERTVQTKKSRVDKEGERGRKEQEGKKWGMKGKKKILSITEVTNDDVNKNRHWCYIPLLHRASHECRSGPVQSLQLLPPHTQTQAQHSVDSCAEVQSDLSFQLAIAGREQLSCKSKSSYYRTLDTLSGETQNLHHARNCKHIPGSSNILGWAASAAYFQGNDYYHLHNLDGAECVFGLVQQRGEEEDGEQREGATGRGGAVWIRGNHTILFEGRNYIDYHSICFQVLPHNKQHNKYPEVWSFKNGSFLVTH